MKNVFDNVGEKIGVEYLYAQTGEILQEIAADTDEDEDRSEEDEDVDDEGFHV